MNWKSLLLGACAPLLLAACATTAPNAVTGAPASPAGKPKYGSFGFDTAGMDAAVAPGDDFYA